MDKQIFKKLAELILHDYGMGGKLPGERVLAERYACARTTIRAALQDLQDRKLLQSHPRRGHRLVASGREPASPGPEKSNWNIVMLASARKMEDQNFLDLLGGVIHAARQSSVNLVIREIADHLDLVGLASLQQLHPGIEADGYILTAFSDQLAPLLGNLLKPCVVLGDSSDLRQIEKKRFVQVYLPQREKIDFMVARLTELGHRNILLAVCEECISDFSALQYPGVDLNMVPISILADSTVPRLAAADAILAALTDHTALIISTGGASALEIYHRITAAGYEVPRRLSVFIDSGRFDYFVRVFNIASIYSSAREEGGGCMEELLCQLRSGSINFMIRKSHYVYLAGNSIGTAMPQVERKRFDREHRLPAPPVP